MCGRTHLACGRESVYGGRRTILVRDRREHPFLIRGFTDNARITRVVHELEVGATSKRGLHLLLHWREAFLCSVVEVGRVLVWSVCLVELIVGYLSLVHLWVVVGWACTWSVWTYVLYPLKLDVFGLCNQFILDLLRNSDQL